MRWVVPADEPEGPADPPATAVEEPEGAPVAAPAPPSDPQPEDMSPEALRARLAARGLLRTEPSVRIREVVPDRPRPRSEPAIEPSWTEPRDPDDPGSEAEAEALEPDPGGSRAPVRCPTCREQTSVAVAATGFACPSCARVWRWAICGGCKGLALTLARQEAWRCGACGHHTRSWWRTETAARERVEVQERRQVDAARRERERVLAAARRRRWKLIVAGVLLVVVAAAIAGVVTISGQGSPADHRRAACNRFERLRTQVTNGTLRGAEVDAELAEIRALATEADPDVATAAARLAAAGRPGTARFLIASTEMADACAAAGP